MLLAIMRIVLLVPLCVNKTYENAACNNDSHFAQASMYKKSENAACNDMRVMLLRPLSPVEMMVLGE